MPRTIIALVLTVLFPLAHAATFTVNNLNDSGFGSLRDAIAQANANPGADTIGFTVTGTILLTSGQIAINGPLSIVGPGAASLTIDANANSRIFSVFATDPACPDFDGPDYLVSISGVRLTNARRAASNAGGAIFTEHSLALDSVIIDNSKAGLGGAVNMQTQYSGQALTIANSQFLNNTAVPLAGPSNAFGGAVAVFERCTPSKTSPVTVDISNSVFSGNQALPDNARWKRGRARIRFLCERRDHGHSDCRQQCDRFEYASCGEYVQWRWYLCPRPHADDHAHRDRQ